MSHLSGPLIELLQAEFLVQEGLDEEDVDPGPRPDEGIGEADHHQLFGRRDLTAVLPPDTSLLRHHRGKEWEPHRTVY